MSTRRLPTLMLALGLLAPAPLWAEPLNPPTPAVPVAPPAGAPTSPPAPVLPKPSLPAESPATKPTAEPSTKPTTKPLASAKSGKAPDPADADGDGFVTPGEMLDHLKAEADTQKAKLHVAFFDFGQAITEKPTGPNLFGAGGGTSLREVIDRMDAAKEDKSVRAVLLNLGTGISLNMAQVQEVRTELDALRRAGKRTFVYADSYDTMSYLLASAATDVCLLQGGDVFIPGVGFETMFYKGALDKLGVEADYIQIGEFKGAEEPYTNKKASPELEGEMNRLAAAVYDQLVTQIGQSRNLPSSEVKRMVDETILSGEQTVKRGYVDHLVDQDGLRDLIASEMGEASGTDLDVMADYGQKPRPQMDLSNPLAMIAAMAKKPEVSDVPGVALIYAEGVISDGEGQGSFLSAGGIGSEPMRRAFREAERNDNVKAVVIRIDSPGGSALASEVMWQAARRVAAKKPVVISVGGMAASGGYYLASAGDRIFADPAGIVGSIGVVGGKFVYSGLYDKLGLTTQSFTKGVNASLYSSSTPWSDRQKRLVRTWMHNTYDQFTDRVMTTRKGKIADIDKVARGRIFTAQQAKSRGLVDELGGLEKALAYAAKKGGLPTGEKLDIRVLPEAAINPLAGLMGGLSAESPVRGVKSDSILRLLPAAARDALIEQVQMIQVFEKRPVALIAPIRAIGR